MLTHMPAYENTSDNLQEVLMMLADSYEQARLKVQAMLQDVEGAKVCTLLDAVLTLTKQNDRFQSCESSDERYQIDASCARLKLVKFIYESQMYGLRRSIDQWYNTAGTAPA